MNNSNNWRHKVTESDWISVKCGVPGCKKKVTICPACGHLGHRGKWNLKDRKQVIIQHAHFTKEEVRDKARNWNCKIKGNGSISLESYLK